MSKVRLKSEPSPAEGAEGSQVEIVDQTWLAIAYLPGSLLDNKKVVQIDESEIPGSNLCTSILILTGVLKMIALTGVSWFLLTGIVQFALPSFALVIFAIAAQATFIAVPIVNHVRMFLAVRRHNNFAAGADVSQQMSVVFRREKKVALDMAIVSLVPLLSLAPAVLNKIIQAFNPKMYIFLQPWAVTMVFLIPSLNPIICTLRNKALRDGMKSILTA